MRPAYYSVLCVFPPPFPSARRLYYRDSPFRKRRSEGCSGGSAEALRYVQAGIGPAPLLSLCQQTSHTCTQTVRSPEAPHKKKKVVTKPAKPGRAFVLAHRAVKDMSNGAPLTLLPASQVHVPREALHDIAAPLVLADAAAVAASPGCDRRASAVAETAEALGPVGAAAVAAGWIGEPDVQLLADWPCSCVRVRGDATSVRAAVSEAMVGGGACRVGAPARARRGP